MAQVTNTAESGLTSTTPVTLANSAVPDGFQAVTPGAGGTITFSSVHAQGGTLAYAFTPASGVQGYVQWSSVAGANSLCAFRGYAYFTGLPSSDTTIVRILSSSAGTGVMAVALTTTGTLRLANEIGSTTIGLSTGSLSVNTWYRIEVTLDNAGGAATGSATLHVYSNAGSIISNMTVTGTGLTIGSNSLGAVRVGKLSTTGSMAVAYWDNLAFKTASNTEIGAATALTAPTAAFTALPGDLSAFVDASTSVAGSGSIDSYTWDWGDGSSLDTTSGVTATHAYALAGPYTITVTLTSSDGLTSSVSHDFVAKAASTTPGFYSMTTTTNWTNTGGAADLLTALTDADGATYALSSASPTALPLKGLLDPAVTPNVGDNVIVRVPAIRISSSSGTLVAKLYEGVTLRITSSAVAIPAGTPPVTGSIDCTFLAVDVATVTAWAAGTLQLQLEATAA